MLVAYIAKSARHKQHIINNIENNNELLNQRIRKKRGLSCNHYIKIVFKV